jgi:16S rRNA (cytidine1402-2'-O)-methyltransferase
VRVFNGGILFFGIFVKPFRSKKKRIGALASETRAMVFYESPHRIRATLSDMASAFGARQMVLFRELTKLFEEIRRGTPTTAGGVDP